MLLFHAPIGGIDKAKAIDVGGGYPAQGAALERMGGRGWVGLVDNVELVVVGKRTHRSAVGTSYTQYIGDNLGLEHGLDAVVDKHEVLWAKFALEVIDALADRIQVRLATRDNPDKLGDGVLTGIALHHVAPAIHAHNADRVDFGVALEALEGVGDDRLVVHRDELLGDVGAHTSADAPRHDECKCCACHLRPLPQAPHRH